MSNMNLLIDVKGYDGSNANTCRANFSRNAQFNGINISEEIIQEITVAASSTITLFTVAPADAKKLIYLESDGECDIIVNGVTESTLKPVVIGDSASKAIFVKSTDIETIDITNNGTDDIKVYYITAK